MEEESGSSGHFILFNAMPSWAVSGVVHFIVFIVLALINVAPPTDTGVATISAAPPEVEEVEEFKVEKIEMNLDDAPVTNTSSEVISALTSEISSVTETPSVAVDVDPAPIAVELSDFGKETAPKNDLLATVGAYTGSGFTGRGEAAKGNAKRYGATDESERAVARALEWFAKHQLPDGGWNFDHRLGQCNGRCGDAGRLSDCRTGATAMALLPFLGAGQTHQDGKYKEVVRRGLYFLTSQMKTRNVAGLGLTGDLAQGGGSMYSHGLSAIVLCEAYGMTHDKGLMGPAQLSLNHIMYAQDPVGGGWRYQPRTPGDTSVVGWQLMALKSGHMAYLKVDPRTILGATKFLDSVQLDSGSKYGYTDPGGGLATTAVGLLCRMYLGWKKDHPALERGVEFLAKTGPSGPKSGGGNMYYNYYATQVMRHYEGEKWDNWNKEMRDWLVRTQESNDKNHTYGSWFMKGDHGAETGGRIYCTSMATMILEVYYRHMPLYAKQAAEDEFPLK